MASWAHPATWALPPRPTKPAYDFVVCGGGTAGCALASRLSEDPSVSVLLLEAGGHGLVLDARVPAACGKLQGTEWDWGDACVPAPGRACEGLTDGASNWPRGKGLAGGSLINYMAWVRGHPSDYDAWAKAAGHERWGSANVAKVFQRVEDCTDIDHGALVVERDVRGYGGAVHVESRKPVNPIAARFVAACEKTGFQRGDYNGRTNDNVVSLHQTTTRRGERWSAADAYIWPHLRSRKNLEVVLHAHVVRVVLDTSVSPPRAAGVEFILNKTEKIVVKCAKEVVLCASPVGSPSILMRSGVGARDKLAKIGVACVVDAPDVGENLQDHVLLPLLVRPSKDRNPAASRQVDIGAVNTANAEKVPTALPALWDYFVKGQGHLASSAYDASGFFRTHPESPWPDAQLSVFVSPANPALWTNNLRVMRKDYIPDDLIAEDAQGFILVPTILHPHSRGKVELRSRDPFAAPIIDHGYFTDPRDVDAFVVVFTRAVHVAREMGYGDVVVPADLEPLLARNDLTSLAKEMVRRFATTIYHPAATCAMGSVVDADLRVRGVAGLRVADSSTFPNLTSGNTNAPSVVVGEICSDVLAEAHGLKRLARAPPAPATTASGAAAAVVVGGLAGFVAGRKLGLL